MSPEQWSEVYLTASAENEPFGEVSIITLKSDYLDRLYEVGVREVGVTNQRLLKSHIKSLIEKDSPSHRVQERVEFKADGSIIVVADIEQITDDAIWKAADMIEQAIDRLDGEMVRPVTVTFNHPVSFEYQHLRGLMTYKPQSPSA